MMNRQFVVPVNRLDVGKNPFEWEVGGEFFATFENSEIIDADLTVSVVIENDDYDISVKGTVRGTVMVMCDRCLENLELPVDMEFDDDEFDDCEVIDLSQDIYDFVCISLPMRRVHSDGECNEETLKYLNG